ncbi:hypothetical protein S7711_10675 [Stachybotrys chartarum IBT 7711]|uniref:Fucose-specific lectin n=1 Tax=Stachybotrys chartarum (strain CBS 109288 / IBT 7711) TaxID=1280523 RepID=A0A084B8F0_STACB|nr:hypothetical protein S7711_10675 [Stachybotrys chartarum IBT 7711]
MTNPKRQTPPRPAQPHAIASKASGIVNRQATRNMASQGEPKSRFPQQRSYWIETDDEDSTNESSHRVVAEARATFRAYLRKTPVIITIVVLVLLIVGAALGAGLSRINVGVDSSETSPTTSSSEEPAKTDEPGSNGPFTNTRVTPEPSDQPRPPSEDDPGEDSRVILHQASQLATGGLGAVFYVGLIVFQTADGEVAVTEFRGEETDTYQIRSRMEDDQMPPKPAGGSPICLLNFGPDNDAHLFYMTAGRRLVHLYRLASPQDGTLWSVGSLALDDEKQLRPAAEALRLSAAIFPTLGPAEDTPGYIGVMFQADAQGSSFDFLANMDPGAGRLWSLARLDLTQDERPLELQGNSPALVLMAYRQEVYGPEPPRLMRRLHFDTPDRGRLTTIGTYDCAISEGLGANNCAYVLSDWTDERARDIYIDAPRPLHFSKFVVLRHSETSTEQYMVLIVDGKGTLYEVLYDGWRWTSFRAFADPGAQSTITSVAAIHERSLFAISDGRLLEFNRSGWNDDGGWQLYREIQLTPAAADNEDSEESDNR